MSDLYDVAARFPDSLVGRRSALTRREVLAAGTGTESLRWLAQAGRAARPFHGVYLLGDRPERDLLDELRALLRVLPPEAAFGWHTGAALHGFGVTRSDRIHVVVPAGSAVPQLRGVAAHQSVVALEPVLVLGVPCLPAVRCAVDLGRHLRRLDALPVLDAALRVGAFSPDDLMAEIARHDGLRGVRRARELGALADPRAECRQESQLRLILHDGGLPPVVPQLSVSDEYGMVRYRLDLAHEEYRVGVELDGESHLDRNRMRHDRQRHNWLEAHGWAMRYFTSHDLYRQPHDVVDTVRRALRSRRAAPRSSIKGRSG